MPPLTLGLDSTHVLITGGAGLIGTAVARAFLAEGSRVTCVDVVAADPANPIEPERTTTTTTTTTPPRGTLSHRRADVTDEAAFARAWRDAVAENGPVDACVALAGLDLSVLEHHGGGAADVGVAQSRRTLDVNVVGTFVAAREWLRGVREELGRGGSDGEMEEEKKRSRSRRRNVNLIIVGSESGWFGERENPDYAAAKSAVQVGLLKSLAADAPRVWEGARVNAVAPGPVDTPRFKEECKNDPEQLWMDAQATTGLGKPVPMEAVANSILFLASDNFSSHVHGQVLNIDSGKQGKVLWTKEQISARA